MASPVPGQAMLPVQPVDQPIICSPYTEPTQHWVYDTETGAATLPLAAGLLRSGSGMSSPARQEPISGACLPNRNGTNSPSSMPCAPM